MNTALTERAAPVVEFHGQLEKRAVEYAKALKQSGIDPAYFERVAKTAVALNPKLLAADRRSLFNALARCAEDGLLPNGRQAVLKIYNGKEGPTVGYERMTEGIRKLVQQSGEITRFEQTIVHANDQFDYELGDHPRILHKPAIGDRGNPILLYSVAQFNDGTLSREVMSAAEINQIRDTYSRAKDGPAWKNSWGEMARKTIAKRHAKVLPMSSDARDSLARDDAEHSELPAAANVGAPPQNRPRLLADKLDALGTAPDIEPKRPRRGRPRRDDEPTDEEIERSQARIAEVLEEEPRLTGEEPELQTETPDNGWPGPSGAVRHDYEQGKRDAIAGRSDCLNRDIRDIATRYAEWKKGFDSVKKRGGQQ